MPEFYGYISKKDLKKLMNEIFLMYDQKSTNAYYFGAKESMKIMAEKIFGMPHFFDEKNRQDNGESSDKKAGLISTMTK